MWTSEVFTLTLRGLSLGLAACVGAMIVWYVGKAGALAPATTGERGRRRAAWLQSGSTAAICDRVVRHVAAAFVPPLPPDVDARLEGALRFAGHPWGFGPRQLLAASACSGAVGLALAVVCFDQLGGALATLVVLVGPSLPFVKLDAERRARAQAVERSLPIAMDLVALCVRAGGDFPGALKFVIGELAHAHAICVHELARIDEAMGLGRTRVDALSAFATRLDSPPVRRFVASMVQSEQRGIPLADALSSQADTLRRLRSVRAEELAAKAGVRMVVPLMLMLLAVLTLLLGPMLLEATAL